AAGDLGRAFGDVPRSPFKDRPANDGSSLTTDVIRPRTSRTRGQDGLACHPREHLKRRADVLKEGLALAKPAEGFLVGILSVRCYVGHKGPPLFFSID